jgi:hypothetical protein
MVHFFFFIQDISKITSAMENVLQQMEEDGEYNLPI